MTVVFWCNTKRFEAVKKLLASIPSAKLVEPIKEDGLWRCAYHIDMHRDKPIQKLTDQWRNEDGWPKNNTPDK